MRERERKIMGESDHVEFLFVGPDGKPADIPEGVELPCSIATVTRLSDIREGKRHFVIKAFVAQ